MILHPLDLCACGDFRFQHPDGPCAFNGTTTGHHDDLNACPAFNLASPHLMSERETAELVAIARMGDRLMMTGAEFHVPNLALAACDMLAEAQAELERRGVDWESWRDDGEDEI